jgi:hypothetical protein
MVWRRCSIERRTQVLADAHINQPNFRDFPGNSQLLSILCKGLSLTHLNGDIDLLPAFERRHRSSDPTTNTGYVCVRGGHIATFGTLTDILSDCYARYKELVTVNTLSGNMYWSIVVPRPRILCSRSNSISGECTVGRGSVKRQRWLPGVETTRRPL